MLVRSAIESISASALRNAFIRTSFTDRQLELLANAVGMSNRSVPLSDILAVELCMSYAEIKHARSEYGDDTDPISLLLYSELPWLGKTWLAARDLSGANLYGRMRFLTIATDAMTHSKLSKVKAYEFYSTVNYKPSLFWDNSVAIETSIRPRLIQVMQLNEARLTVAQTALAVERFRLSEVRLPYELLELVPKFLDEVPPDPFTGTPLIYVQVDDGYRVYSVGRNFVDEDGNGSTSGDSDLGDDIGFEH